MRRPQEALLQMAALAADCRALLAAVVLATRMIDGKANRSTCQRKDQDDDDNDDDNDNYDGDDNDDSGNTSQANSQIETLLHLVNYK